MIYSQKKYGIPATPNYAALTGADVFDSTGLRPDTANANGTVDSFGNVTLWKSLINSGKTFTGVNVKAEYNLLFDRVKQAYVIYNQGAGLFRQASAVQSRTDFGYLWHHASGYASMRWTIHCLMKTGMTDFYGSVLPIIACNAGGANTPGIIIYTADRLAATQDNTFSLQLTKATAGAINVSTTNNVIPSGSWKVISVEFNGSLGATNSIKLYVDGVLQVINNTSTSTTTNTNNANALEIMGFGNATFTKTSCKMSHLIIQNVVESAGVRNTIMAELQAWADYMNDAEYIASGNDITTAGQTTKLIQENRYYLTCKIIQDKVNDNKLVALFTNGTNSAGDAGKRLSIIKSTDYGKTWGAITTVYDPAGTEFVQCANAGVTDGNKYVAFFTTHVNTSGTIMANPTKLYYTYSTDQGTTWQTPVDITSAVPSDTLTSWANESQVVCNNGRIMFGIYKVTAALDATQSANYLIYSDDDGATWGNVTIRSIGTDYINESSMLHLSGDNLYMLIGSYADNDWRCYTSSNNGSSWTYQGLMDFTAVDTTPSILQKFKINGVEYAAFHYYVPSAEIHKTAYAKVSELLANPLTAWPLGIRNFEFGQSMMHGDFCYFNDSLRAVFVSPIQPDTPTYTNDSLGLGYTVVPLPQIIAALP